MIGSLRRLLASAILVPGFAVAAHAGTMPRIMWSTQIKVPIYSMPQQFDGRIYLTSAQSDGPNVFALDGGTGKILWSFGTRGSIAIPPTVEGAQLFVASDMGDTHFMRAINAENGALIWEYTRNQPPECMCSYKSTLAGGLLFAQTDGHSLYAFEPHGSAPSRRVWFFAGDGALLTKPVSAEGMVVVGSADRNVYGLDAKTGKTIWTRTTGYAFTADPVIVNSVVVIGDQGGNIDGFDVKSGKQLWSITAGGAIDEAAAVGRKTAFVLSEDRNVYAIDVARGHLLWRYAMDDYAEHAPLVEDGLVIIGNRAGQLIGLDTAKGKAVWQTNLGGTPFSAPIAWNAGKAVVLKVGDHAIAAFDTASGKEKWRYQTDAVVTVPVVRGGDVELATNEGDVLALN